MGFTAFPWSDVAAGPPASTKIKSADLVAVKRSACSLRAKTDFLVVWAISH
jgi:hypothetical protein